MWNEWIVVTNRLDGDSHTFATHNGTSVENDSVLHQQVL